MPEQSHFQTAQDKLEQVQLRFLRLLEEIPEGDWDRKPAGRGWTIKQEMVHVVQVLELLPAGIERACRGGERSLLGLVPPGLRNWMNGRIIIPLRAKDETRESIARAYRAANQTLVSILEKLAPEDWAKGMPYPRRYRTVEQMAYRPVEHFAEHEAHIRRSIETAGDSG